MKRKELEKQCIALVMAGLLVICGCGKIQDSTTEGVENSDKQSTFQAQITSMDISQMFSNRDKEIGYEEDDCVKISLQGKEASVAGKGVEVKENQVVITEKGNYLLSGDYTGSIVVDASKQDKIHVILDNVNLTCDGTAPFYVKQADKVFVTLAPDSKNNLVNTGQFVAVDENNIDGAIFAKDEIAFNGTGSLSVTSKAGHGIVCKDDLVITSGDYQITAAKKGLAGKDSVRIANGTIDITSGTTGIYSDNEEDGKGFIYIADGNITIEAGKNGISAESCLLVDGGTVDITKSQEGLEGKTVEIAGGRITINATDDGINATAHDGSGFPGFGRLNPTDRNEEMKPQKDFQDDEKTISDSDVAILVSGGTLKIRARGDGLDSNGTITISGGEIYISGPEDNGNGAIDYETAGTITGGIVVAVGAGGMAENFGNQSTQCAILVKTDTSYPKGTEVVLKDSEGKDIVSYTPESAYNSVVISSPDLQVGQTYTLYTGTDSQDITLDEIITGTGGFDGEFRGGFGAGPSFRGKPKDGFDGQKKP